MKRLTERPNYPTQYEFAVKKTNYIGTIIDRYGLVEEMLEKYNIASLEELDKILGNIK